MIIITIYQLSLLESFHDSKQTHLMNNFSFFKSMWALILYNIIHVISAKYCDYLELTNELNKEDIKYKIIDGDEFHLWTKYVPYQFLEKALNFSYIDLVNITNQSNNLSYQIKLSEGIMNHSLVSQISLLSFSPEFKTYEGMWIQNCFIFNNNQLNLLIIVNETIVYDQFVDFVFDKFYMYAKNDYGMFPGFVSKLYKNEERCPKLDKYHYQQIFFEPFLIVSNYAIGMWFRIQYQNFEDDKIIIMNCINSQKRDLFTIFLKYDFIDPQNSTLNLRMYNQTSLNISDPYEYLIFKFELDDFQGNIQDWSYLSIYYSNKIMQFYIFINQNSNTEDVIFDLGDQVYQFSYQEVIPQENSSSQSVEIYAATLRVNIDYEFEDDDFMSKIFDYLVCHYSCRTCFGPLMNNCLSCQPKFNREYNQKQKTCQCISGYIDFQYDYVCESITSILPNIEKIETMNATIGCEPGYYQVLKQCFECPQIQDSQNILCGDCFDNAIEFQNKYICTYDYFRDDFKQGYQKLQRREQDYVQYAFDLDKFQLVLCDGCRKFCTDLTQQGCFISKYMLNNQFVSIICKLSMYIFIFQDYVFKDGYCERCADNCDVCDQTTSFCKLCRFNYALQNNQCIQCSENCLECAYDNQNNLNCLMCKKGYYYDGYQCKQCGTNCFYCELQNGLPVCKNCFDNYNYFISGQDCLTKTIRNCQHQYEYQNNIYCALCHHKYVNYLSYCQYDENLMDDEQIIIKNSRTINILKRYESNNLLKNKCFIKFCEYCIENYNNNHQFCVKCQIGYYSNIQNGQCKQCPKDCYSCIQSSANYDDAWKWSIIPFKHFILGNHKEDKENDYQILCLSCFDDYELYNGHCIKPCHPSCKECQKQDNQNICIKCFDSPLGQQLSIFNNECIECPLYCNFCLPRRSITQIPEEQFIKYQYKCLKPYSSVKKKLFYNKDFQQYVHCEKGFGCMKQIKITINSFCDYRDYQSFGQSSDFYINELFSKDPNSHFRKIESDQIINYLNEEQVDHIYYNIELISDQFNFCQIEPNTFIYSRLKKNIFTLQMVSVYFYSRSPIYLSIQDEFVFNGFDSVKIENIYFQVQNANLKVIDCKYLYIYNSLFQGFEQNNYIKFQTDLVQQLEIINVAINKTTFANIQVIQLKTTAITIIMKNFSLNDCQFYNSTLLYSQQSHIYLDVELLNIYIQSSFHKSRLVYFQKGYSNNFSIISITNSYHNVQLEQSQLYDIQNIKDVDITDFLIDNSTLEDSTILMASQYCITFMLVNNNIFINSSIIKYNDYLNKQTKVYLIEVQIINNTYSQFSKFITIVNPTSQLVIQDSIIKHNQLKYSQILGSNNLFELSVKSLVLKNIIYLKQDGLSDFLLRGISNITLQSVTVTQSMEKMKFLHQEKQCFISQINSQNYGYFITIQDLVNLTIDSIQITGVQTINYGIINIISVQKIDKIQIQIINSKFIDNQIAITNKQQFGGIIVIHTELQGSILVKNVIFTKNLMIDYATDNNAQSGTLLSFYVPFQQVDITNCHFDRNHLFNSINSIVTINSQSLMLQNSDFTNSNLYDYQYLKDSMIFGFFKDINLYHEQVQNVIQNKNYGGSANLKAQQITIINCQIENSFGQMGGAFYLTVGSQLYMQQCRFRNSQANLQSTSSQGGALYIADSDRNLEINIIDTKFTDCYSFQNGGAIMVASKISQFLKINMFNIYGKQTFSLDGAFLQILSTNNINQILNIDRFTYENTKEGSFKLLSQLDINKNYRLGFLFDIQQGILLFNNIELVQLVEYGLVSCKNTQKAQFNLILASIFTNKFIDLNGGLLNQDISFKQIQIKRGLQSFESITCQTYQEKVLQQNDMKCMNFEPLLDLETFFNHSYLQNKAICNLKKIESQDIKSLIYINIQNMKTKLVMSDLYVQGIQCQFCNFGIIFIGNIQSDSNNQIILSKIQLKENICGYTGCINIIGSEQFFNMISNSKSGYPTFVLQDSYLIQNDANRGGGLFISDVDVLVKRTQFIGNKAIYGGAIYQIGENNLEMQFSKFSNNQAIEGQSIYLQDLQLNLSKQKEIELDSNQNKQLISEKPTKLSLLYKNVELNKTILVQNSTLYREEIELIQGKPIYLPSGYHLDQYKIFDQEKQDFVNKNISILLVALNDFNQKQISLNKTKCFISSVNDDLQYFSKQAIDYNYQQQGYVLDDLVIRYDPYKNESLQIKINCDSISRQNHQKYELLLNVKTYYCQRGEFYNKSEGTCNLCDQNQQFYTVIAGGLCKQINNQFMDETTSARIKLKQGYWRPSETNDNIEYCKRRSQNCIGGWDAGNKLCQIGNIGALCEQCDIYNIKGDGRFAFKDTNQCASCGEETFNYIIIIMIIIGTLLSIFLSVKGTVQNIEWTTKIIKLKQIGLRIQLNKENNSSVLIKLFINYIIILSSITTFQIELPHFINDMIVKTSNPIQSISYSIDCLLINFYYIDILYLRQIYSILIPLIYSTMFLICFNILLLLKKTKYTFSIISTSILYIYSYMQPNLIGGLISILAYRVISNITWIQGNVSYQYFTQQHKQWLFYFIIPILLIISTIIPFCIILLLYKKQKMLNKPKFRMIWGYLYIEYIDSAYFWEIIKLQQKQIIICILTFYEDLIVLKSILIFLTIVLYDVISKIKQPYKKRKQNQLDQKVSQILAGSIIFAQIIYITQQYSIQQYQYPFYALLFIINAYFIILLLSKILIIFLSYFQNSIEILKEYLVNKLPIYKLGYTINLLFVLKKDKKRRITTRINIIRQNLFPQAKKIAMFRRQTTTMITQETLMTENTSNKSNNDLIKLISSNEKNNNLQRQQKLENYPQLNQMIRLITGNISRKE